MKRTHLCVKPDCAPRTKRQPDPTSRGHDTYKPRGLWYQVNGDWERWMTAERWSPRSYCFTYELDLADANVLRISDAIALDELTREYAVGMPWHKSRSDAIALGSLDWKHLAERYDGLEIAPYLWEVRMEYMWYYGWDCASGVLWRPRSASLTFVGHYAPAETVKS